MFNLVQNLHIQIRKEVNAELRRMERPNLETTMDILQTYQDPVSRSILDKAMKAAKSNATILISGETGVGKELISKFIHQHSPFSAGPYVSVNCAALPENMIESILFGYEKGAFTGAINAYPGKFEQADNGTLLLDEIAELPLGLQAKMLRVLQEREIERLGGRKLIKVNVRIIAASNRNLAQQVQAGLFRSDLYYRLNVVPIHCEALRNRQLDIIPLANFFIQKYSALLERELATLSEEAIQKLIRYSWPGNIRELESTIHRTLIMLNGNVIGEKDIILSELDGSMHQPVSWLNTELKASEAKIILNALNEVEGSREIAAKKLNISPRTLRYKISKLKSIGIKIP